MGAGDLSITAFLEEISTRLDDVAARARAALSCAESGSEDDALRIAININEVKMPHGAMRLAGSGTGRRPTPDASR